MLKINVPKSHPRYLSNFYRDLLAEGVKKGITSLQGLTAHGRGETFDYLLGEKTQKFTKKAIEAASALLVSAKHPVLSVNGNTAILVPKELVELSRLLGAKLEVNLFHASCDREQKIVTHLKHYGAKEVLLPNKAKISHINSNRKMISAEGQAKADAVFIPLEDGDRTEALIAMGKKVITVDLNPLSRTAQKATVTIVDNIIRAMPLLIKKVKSLKHNQEKKLSKIIKEYNNSAVLSEALAHICSRLTFLASKEGADLFSRFIMLL